MKTFLLALLLSAPLAVWAQAKKPVARAAMKPATSHRQSAGMEGLGRFKINQTTTAVIAELSKEFGVPLQHGYSILRLAELADSTALMEVDYQPREEYPDASQYGNGCPGSRAIYVTNYTISDIPVKAMCLTFYKDVLVGIQVEKPEELADAFALKYGKPSLRVTKTPKNCVFTYTGNKITYEDATYFSSWYNGGITATHTVAKYYDSNCKPQYLSYFVVEDVAKMAILTKCSEAVEKAAEAKQAAAKKKKLSEL